MGGFLMTESLFIKKLLSVFFATIPPNFVVNIMIPITFHSSFKLPCKENAEKSTVQTDRFSAVDHGCAAPAWASSVLEEITIIGDALAQKSWLAREQLLNQSS